MRKQILATVLTLISIAWVTAGAATYDELWKKFEAAQMKDQPKTELNVLRQIVEKAEKEKAYGHLLKARLTVADVQVGLSPDSLQPEMLRLEAEAEQGAGSMEQGAGAVRRAILYATLYNICKDNDEEDLKAKASDYAKAAMRDLEALHQAKVDGYNPLIEKAADSEVFGNDMLSVIGYAVRDYKTLHDFYLEKGNERAACLLALMLRPGYNDAPIARYNVITNGRNLDYSNYLDSLLSRYSALDVCCEVAIERMNYFEKTEEQIAFVRESLKKWGNWKRANMLKNRETELTSPQYRIRLDNCVVRSGEQQQLRLDDVRNLNSATLNIYRLEADGTLAIDPWNTRELNNIKKPAKPTVSKVIEFAKHADYELFNDTCEIPALNKGVYLIELISNPTTETKRMLYYVSDLTVVAFGQPDNAIRYAVLDSKSGLPVKNASLRLSWNAYRGQSARTETLKTDANGEAVWRPQTQNSKQNVQKPSSVYAYTATDKALRLTNAAVDYYYNDRQNDEERTMIFTDRAVYRPGQTVHVAAIVSRFFNAIDKEVVANKEVKAELRDANHKVIAEKTIKTDEFGKCSVDFVLPNQTLTGSFSVLINGLIQRIRVEEYKRPTFNVEVEPVAEGYAFGDTLQVKATAMTFSGMPVQNARVHYRIARDVAYWWGLEGLPGKISANAMQIFEGETVSDGAGNIVIPMPLTAPEDETARRMDWIYSAVITVTDMGGESHEAGISLPIGKRKVILSTNLPNKIVIERPSEFSFRLENMRGTALDSNVSYTISPSSAAIKGEKEYKSTVKTGEKLSLPALKSGRYTLTAIAEGDTLRHNFVLFSLQDTHAPVDTLDWWYVSGTQFPSECDKITIQAGTSADVTHILYMIASGKKVIEQGSLKTKNGIVNRTFEYKPEYGNGLRVCYMWVKDGKIYWHWATIQRPIPNDKLQMKWETFRNRLTPGQKEEWKISIIQPDSSAAKASVLATMYDKSLDMIASNPWNLFTGRYLPLPSVTLFGHNIPQYNIHAAKQMRYLEVPELSYNSLPYFPNLYSPYIHNVGMYHKAMRARGKITMLSAAKSAPMMMNAAAKDEMAMESVVEEEAAMVYDCVESFGVAGGVETKKPEIRTDLSETAFFYPNLLADSLGNVSIAFTLPQSVTTWHFRSLAHTKDMMFGQLEDDIIAQKELMIQPNIPRFIRSGDNATISARVFNNSNKPQKTTVRLAIIAPETEEPLVISHQPLALEADSSAVVTFNIDTNNSKLKTQDSKLLVCRLTVEGETHSDGEQVYLPILPASEPVMRTVAITQSEPGTIKIPLDKLFGVNATDKKLTVEYTANPAWLVIQALPSIAEPTSDNAISLATALYSNLVGKGIMESTPAIKRMVNLWKAEQATPPTSPQGEAHNIHSLRRGLGWSKLLSLNETPWLADAEKEEVQKLRLAEYFDENVMDYRTTKVVEKLKELQLADGSWPWFKGMGGSEWITSEVVMTLTRMNALTPTLSLNTEGIASQRRERSGKGEGAKTQNSKLIDSMLEKAWKYTDKAMVKYVDELKKDEQKSKNKGKTYISESLIDWLYASAISSHEGSIAAQNAKNWVLTRLKKQAHQQTISVKAKVVTVMLANGERGLAKDLAESLSQNTVYRDDLGRYFDTRKAAYSWRDYKIPTQTAAIEALQAVGGYDKEVAEMQRWLLSSKRTQMWDTPINSVNAVYAFLSQHTDFMDSTEGVTICLDDEKVETDKPTSGIGYVKTSIQNPKAKELTIEKNPLSPLNSHAKDSWGAAYGISIQPIKDIKASSMGLAIAREVFVGEGNAMQPYKDGMTLKPGQKVTVRLTVTADRDYDFVQIVDKRAACMEPVSQISGYQHGGYYISVHDTTTDYFMDMCRKGKHRLETTYYIDRPGQYNMGTATVQCAYSPEYHGQAAIQSLDITK